MVQPSQPQPQPRIQRGVTASSWLGFNVPTNNYTIPGLPAHPDRVAAYIVMHHAEDNTTPLPIYQNQWTLRDGQWNLARSLLVCDDPGDAYHWAKEFVNHRLNVASPALTVDCATNVSFLQSKTIRDYRGAYVGEGWTLTVRETVREIRSADYTNRSAEEQRIVGRECVWLERQWRVVSNLARVGRP
jgi:hypothetical protein